MLTLTIPEKDINDNEKVAKIIDGFVDYTMNSVEQVRQKLAERDGGIIHGVIQNGKG